MIAIGGIAAVIGFVALPYYTVSASTGGVSRSLNASAHLFTKSKSSGGEGYTQLWGVLAMAILLIVLGAALALRAQARSIAVTAIAVSLVGLSILIQVLVAFNDLVNKETGGRSFPGVSYAWGIGFWLDVAGMAVAIIGAVIAMSRAKK